MKSARPIVLLMACAVAGTIACGSKSIRAPQHPGHELIALLPDADGSVGRAVVSTPEGTVDLSAARQSTVVAVDRPPAPVKTLSQADIQQVFGPVLAALPPAPESFTLFFRFDSEDLTAESRGLTRRALEAVRNHASPEIVVRGHTDTTGTTAQNFDLGLKRARKVRTLLIATGVDPAAIDVMSHGESELLVPTADNVFEPRNRRVEITVR